jgi:hypothetical protein
MLPIRTIGRLGKVIREKRANTDEAGAVVEGGAKTNQTKEWLGKVSGAAIHLYRKKVSTTVMALQVGV